MKIKIIIAIFFLTIIHNIKSQVPQLFPTDSSYWDIDFICWDGGNPIFSNQSVSIVGDTIIDNKHYSIFLSMVGINSIF